MEWYVCPLCRYFHLRKHILNLPREVKEMMPGTAEEEDLLSLLKNYVLFEAASKDLQNSNVSLLDAHVIFRTFHKFFPGLTNYTSDEASIKHSPQFESAVVKVLS
ncbi:hypothetical protein GEMRC1_007811 [Eukaryota sp. GEM-RC1]